MTDTDPDRSNSDGFNEAARRSRAAGIADESASYAVAVSEDGGAGSQGADGIPQTGEEDPLAEVSTDEPPAGAGEFAKAERQKANDGVEPDHVPGTAADIEIDGVTGPGPSG